MKRCRRHVTDFALNSKGKKCEVIPHTYKALRHEGEWGSGVQLNSFSISAVQRGEWSASRP
jgi:hypothetical protein